jgi:hypothetical protein
MTTSIQVEIANAILATTLVTKVFHSSELLRDNERGLLFPAYRAGADYIFIPVDDTLGLYAYIRSNGDYQATPLKIASCVRSYDMSVPLRIVFFSDNEKRDRNFLIEKLASFSFMTGVQLIRVIDDKFRLIREEAPLVREKFDGQTFYIAFDVLVKKVLSPSDCERDECEVFTNPICQL